MSEDELKKRALEYHSNPIPGKFALLPSKEMRGPADLSLAYSPGVAQPCLEI